MDKSRRWEKGPWLLASSFILALLVSPFAIAASDGGAIIGGARNPSSNESLNLGSETQIIAKNSTYGTRQSNKGTGGGAIYGCRSAAAQPPCVRSSNLNTGLAFEFTSRGTVGGRIVVGAGGDATKPFTTSATGVATGLNADRVDGLSATDIINQAKGAVTPACPAGTVAALGACFDTTVNPAANYYDAIDACARAGERLATAAELSAIRNAQGITLADTEMTSDLVVEPASGQLAYATVSPNRSIGYRILAGAKPYRCVLVR